MSVSTSVGGTVELRAPVTKGVSPVVMHTVKDIPIPADATTQLIPNSYHLLITDPGAMHDGKDIYLTLTFAHGLTMTVIALVTNPAERRLELLPELIARPAAARPGRLEPARSW